MTPNLESSRENDQPDSKPADGVVSKSNTLVKVAVFLVVAAVVLVAYTQYGDLLSLENLAKQEGRLREFQAENPVLVYGAAFLVYVVVTGLSLPGAAILTLVYGWYFGLFRGVVLVSFASTAGATMAFLLSRFLFRDAIQKRFGERLESFNAALEREGAFFLFTLRLIPAVPFFIINAVMGLTPIRTITFWWVSQLGMLAATIVYVYAGSSVPDLQTLAENGVGAAFTSSQLTQIVVAFVLLGVFPLAVRYMMKFSNREGSSAILDTDGTPKV
ncbi:TVP38/TMEM64 family protein [Rubripirellula amarantea]|nr:TVP38/TMEM64 family protein [Rubripirellula amarantea]